MTKWKPRKLPVCDGEYNIMSLPCINSVGFTVSNEPLFSRNLYVWLDTKEAKEFAEAIIDEVNRVNRIRGIRDAPHVMRWQ